MGIDLAAAKEVKRITTCTTSVNVATCASASSTSTSAADSTSAPPPPAAAAASQCQVCLVAPREGFALVPCGRSCVLLQELRKHGWHTALDAGCLVCRAFTSKVMHVFV